MNTPTLFIFSALKPSVRYFCTGSVFIFFSLSLWGQSATTNPKLTELIVDWNQVAYQVAFEHDQFYSFIGIRTLCMTHLAMHDALNAIDPQYETYTDQKSHSNADPTVALSMAAWEVLVDAYPKRRDTLHLILQQWLPGDSTRASWQAGKTLGQTIAHQIIQLREGDGHEKRGDYTPMTKPGDYQYTPGWDNWVLKPDFDYARPFTLDTVTQFRSPAPPSLTSETYAASLNEVKEYGKKGSRVRTADQTAYAHWWAEFAEHGWNRIGRIVAKERTLSPATTARMFALVNMDIYDIYLASMESKYHYDTWRPITAIHQADQDGNPHTKADPDWEPEMLTPPWPEYPSAHAAVAAGGAEILTHVLGTPEVSFEMESVSALPSARTRAYQNLDQAAQDCADSRIMNGYHFRFATEEGAAQGRKIARHIHQHFLRPLDAKP